MSFAPPKEKARTGSPFRPLALACVFVLAVLDVLAGPAGARISGPAPQDASSREYDIKAVFLFRFTQYFRWPDNPEPEAYAIAVLGESEIVAPLEEIARKSGSGPKPIIVKRCAQVDEIGRPQILFIPKSAAPRIGRVLEAVRGTNVLTVGETEDLGGRGVAVNFVLRNGTIRFEVSEKALEAAGVLAGSQLLKLAILVDKDNRGEGR